MGIMADGVDVRGIALGARNTGVALIARVADVIHRR